MNKFPLPHVLAGLWIITVLIAPAYCLENAAVTLRIPLVDRQEISTQLNGISQELDRHLKEIDDTITSTSHAVRGFSFYFDTPDLLLLDNQSCLTYVIEKEDKTVREKLSMLRWSESGGITESTFAVRHYNRIVCVEDKHPLLKLIKRSERNGFKEVLNRRGVGNPFLLRPVLNVFEAVEKVSFFNNGRLILTLFFTRLGCRKFGCFAGDGVIKIISPGEAGEDGREKRLVEEVSRFLREYNPGIETVEVSDYALMMKRFREKIPFFSVLIKYPVIYKLLRALLYALIGGGLFFLFFRKRLVNDRCDSIDGN